MKRNGNNASSHQPYMLCLWAWSAFVFLSVSVSVSASGNASVFPNVARGLGLLCDSSGFSACNLTFNIPHASAGDQRLTILLHTCDGSLKDNDTSYSIILDIVETV